MLERFFKMYKKKLEPSSEDKKQVWMKIKDSAACKKCNGILRSRVTWKSFLASSFVVVAVLGYLGYLTFLPIKEGGIFIGKEDDWLYDPSDDSMLDKTGKLFSAVAPTSIMESSDSIGYSTGGAKDINNFRENIKNSYLPIPTDITYEGVFYDYYFDKEGEQECTKLFCPSYNLAVSKDPFSEKEQYFMSVGLNSNIKESDFERKKLNLVVVLDISGSMSSSFDSYYYDQFGNQRELADEEDNSKTKMQLANEAVVELLGHLEEEDRFGMVLFDDEAYLAKPLRRVGDTNVAKIKDHVLEIESRGGTNMEAGIEEGTELFSEYIDQGEEDYENRIIFLTDAMPNTGAVSEGGLFQVMDANSKNKLYTTFIGIGVDFNTELVEYITKVRGANYYSVHSASEFKQRMDEGFEYMVTPLVFDLELKLAAEGFEIIKAYGSPEADEATGEIMKVNTLFPSKTEQGATKGGVILLQLTKIADEGNLTLTVNYKDRNGKEESSTENLEFTDYEAEYFENSSIKKAVLLARYVNLMKNWINDERQALLRHNIFQPCVSNTEGIIIPKIIDLGEWERQSVALDVSAGYKEIFVEFRKYFAKIQLEIEDEVLNQEIEILDELIK